MAKQNYVVKVKTELADVLIQTRFPLDKNCKVLISSFINSLLSDLCLYRKDWSKYEKILQKRIKFEQALLLELELDSLNKNKGGRV